jgi:putative ABC transport system permease protein
VKRVDASLPLRKAQPLPVFVSESTAPERFRALVLSILTLLGVLLAAVGISGVTYRSVVDRTRDFAVRLALGSEPGGVIRLVIVEALRDVAMGAAAGLAGGVTLAILLARWLQNIAPVEMTTTAIAMAIMSAAGLAAALVPALRVRRVEPAHVLRG